MKYTRSRKLRQRSRRKRTQYQRGGGLKEDAIAYLKSIGKDDLLSYMFSLAPRNPNGSRNPKVVNMGGFVFTVDGHPAQSMYLYAKRALDDNDVDKTNLYKRNNKGNSKWVLLESYSDH